MIDKFAKRLSKKARRGFRGWPMATIAFYGPDRSRASKVAVGIIPAEGAAAEQMQAWHSDATDVRQDPAICAAIVSFIDANGVHSVSMSDGIIGCPHQEGIDYEGPWCPECDFWRGRDRFTGRLLA